MPIPIQNQTPTEAEVRFFLFLTCIYSLNPSPSREADFIAMIVLANFLNTLTQRYRVPIISAILPHETATVTTNTPLPSEDPPPAVPHDDEDEVAQADQINEDNEQASIEDEIDETEEEEAAETEEIDPASRNEDETEEIDPASRNEDEATEIDTRSCSCLHTLYHTLFGHGRRGRNTVTVEQEPDPVRDDQQTLR